MTKERDQDRETAGKRPPPVVSEDDSQRGKRPPPETKEEPKKEDR